MVWRLLAALFLLVTCPLGLSAQVRPGAFTTLATTNTGVNSLNVGCAIGSTTCTGGIDAGSLALSSTLAVVGTSTLAGVTATTGTFTGQVLFSATANTAGAPGLSFVGDTDTGLYRQAADVIFLSLGGTDRWVFAGDQLRAAASGSAAAPTFTWHNDTGVNTGIYRIGEGQIGLSTESTLRTSWGATGTLTHTGSLALTAAISPSALAAGSNNNYNPTDLASNIFVRVAANAAGSTLTGLTAQPAGTVRVICEINGDSLTFANQSGSSTAANGFQMAGDGDLVWATGYRCAGFWYDGTSSFWRHFFTS